jgi:hypothetical protein
MPTLLRHGPYRFFFYSGDRWEPRHVHVERDGCHAKFWLLPVSHAYSTGFGQPEIARLSRIVAENRFRFMREWDGYFRK